MRTRIQIRNAQSDAFTIDRPMELDEAQIVFDANLGERERDPLVAKVIATFPNVERVWIGAGNMHSLLRLGALPWLRKLCVAGQFTEELSSQMIAARRTPRRELILEKGSRFVPRSVAEVTKRLVGADHAHRDLLQFVQFAPHLQQMRALRFRSGGAAVGLLRSPAARSLRRLSFGALDDEMIHALTTSPELSALARLSLRFDPRHGPRLVSRFGPRLRNTSARQLDATAPTRGPWVAG